MSRTNQPGRREIAKAIYLAAQSVAVTRSGAVAAEIALMLSTSISTFFRTLRGRVDDCPRYGQLCLTFTPYAIVTLAIRHQLSGTSFADAAGGSLVWWVLGALASAGEADNHTSPDS